MMDTRLVTDIAAVNNRRHEEFHWLTRLFEAKAMAIPKSGFPLDLAISLFNKDYADLTFTHQSVVIKIAPAGIAALRSRGAVPR